jgi:rfaE bifunctional protein nucleotidyltransferase chain/domain
VEEPLFPKGYGSDAVSVSPKRRSNGRASGAPDVVPLASRNPDSRLKIKTLGELGVIAQELRATGKEIALCHGVFDLLHLGHVRHLKAGSEQAHVLMVTLTADQFVNKGPGRPVFSENIRAEMLASMDCVDYVAINDGPTAMAVLETIKPNVYVKGSDYENPDDDITGNIRAERTAVEENAGRIYFTRDMTFSSSSLINKYFDVYDPPLRAFLDRMRAEDAISSVFDLIESVKNMRVLIVGDAIIDEYRYVKPLGKTSKENIIATQFEDRETFAGGAFAAANHVANFCSEVEIVTAIGGADDYEHLIRNSLKPNVKLTAIKLEGRPTTRKLRFVDSNYMRKLFEVYFMDDQPSSLLDPLVAERASKYDVVIVTDFGHGIINRSTIDILCAESRFLAVNTQTNSANAGFNLISKYPRADYVCIDSPEARLAMADRFGDLSKIAAEHIPALVNCSNVVITQGSEGCIVYRPDVGACVVPAFTKTVVDTIGAGDAFLAVTSPLVAAGGHPELVGLVGNAVGAVKVGIVGHRSSVEKTPLLKYIGTLLK